MIKNAKSLMDKSRKLAANYNITANEVLQNYMFERILERLSISEYKSNFILKGGLLLSSIMGIDTRTTMDMDTCIKGINLTDEQLYKVLKEILNIDVGDNVSFEIKNSEPIREEDDYGGLRYNIIAKFDNIKVNLSIDIATGDLITPREIEYDYKMIFEDKSLKIMTYNIESIIAEKFQTVISRGILNSRMKDYYDLYYLLTYKEISKKNLKNAIIRTFEKRETDINNIDRVFTEIKTSDFIKELWISYSKQHSYADNIEFEQVINVIQKIKEIINDKGDEN
jgi:predicted nucleotidyltransferase component of viral defense system